MYSFSGFESNMRHLETIMHLLLLGFLKFMSKKLFPSKFKIYWENVQCVLSTWWSFLGSNSNLPSICWYGGDQVTNLQKMILPISASILSPLIIFSQFLFRKMSNLQTTWNDNTMNIYISFTKAQQFRVCHIYFTAF